MYVLIKNRGPKSEALDCCDARIQSEVSETPGNAKQTRFTWRKSPNYGWKTKKLTGERGGGRGEKEDKKHEEVRGNIILRWEAANKLL